MIASARQLADPRTRAKQRLRAVAAGRGPASGRTDSRPSATRRATSLLTAHPAASAATVLALLALVGPVRLIRLGLAAVRTLSMAAGVFKLVGGLPGLTTSGSRSASSRTAP